jgi:UDP-N-acetylmuramoyl-tripeptide--D-alanyl-D-alanine ligase
VPEHRQQVVTTPRGVVVVDDTFNSNPDGARTALELVARHATEGRRRVVVTPGMVELGSMQDDANRVFGQEAAALATDVLIVGRTNRGPLLEGARGGPATIVLVANRDEAVTWVRDNLGPGDVVLYENDLPDHYA